MKLFPYSDRTHLNSLMRSSLKCMDNDRAVYIYIGGLFLAIPSASYQEIRL